MKEGTHGVSFQPESAADALFIARFLNMYLETGKAAQGKKYSSYTQLEMAVHKAFLAEYGLQQPKNPQNQK
jgi:hypothetical protein